MNSTIKIFILTLVSVLSLTLTLAQNEKQEELDFREKVYAELKAEVDDCFISNGPNGITKKNDLIEIWRVNSSNKEYRIIQIEWYTNDMFYQESYIDHQGKLLYAIETEKYIPINSNTLQTWNWEYFFKGGELKTWTSLGPVKIENEDWTPEHILKSYKNRLDQLKLMKF